MKTTMTNVHTNLRISELITCEFAEAGRDYVQTKRVLTSITFTYIG